MKLDKSLPSHKPALISEHVTSQLSLAEYTAIISMIVTSVYLLLISFFPLVYSFTSYFEPIDFLKNLFFFIMGLGTLAGAFFLLKKETYLQHIADETFDRVIYQRLEPVLRDVAEVQVGLTDVQNRLELMNMNIETLSKKRTSESQEISNTAYYIKYIVLINITLAVFLFMLQYPFGYIPYAITLLYIIWWAVITAEYRLWNVDIVWTWVFIPIILLPLYTIIMNAYLPDYQLFGSLFIALCIYILLYYSWCTFMIKRVLPFDLQDAIKSAQEKIEKAKKDHKKTIKVPEIAFKLNTPPRHQTGMGMILLAIALFTLTWFGYAIQHGLIPNTSWEILRVEGFVWSASYTYVLNFLGVLLILLGLKFIKRIEI